MIETIPLLKLEDQLPDNVLVQTIALALQNPEWSRHWPDKAPIDNLQGKFIYIKPHSVLEKPLYLSAQTTELNYLIVVGEGSQACLFEECRDTSEQKINVKIVAERQSQLDCYKLQNQPLDAHHYAKVCIDQAADSVVTRYAFSLGAQSGQEQLNVKLKGAGACNALYGLYLPFSGQCLENDLHIEHCVANGSSQQLYKAIIDDKGKGIFNGKVKVYSEAQKTTACQSNQNLLLADNAIAETKPELEIYADDVKCSHGATVGQIDQQALFYLRSRGIDEQTARSLLLTAFAEALLEPIPHKDLGDYLRHQVLRKINQLRERPHESD